MSRIGSWGRKAAPVGGYVFYEPPDVGEPIEKMIAPEVGWRDVEPAEKLPGLSSDDAARNLFLRGVYDPVKLFKRRDPNTNLRYLARFYELTSGFNDRSPYKRQGDEAARKLSNPQRFLDAAKGADEAVVARFFEAIRFNGEMFSRFANEPLTWNNKPLLLTNVTPSGGRVAPRPPGLDASDAYSSIPASEVWAVDEEEELENHSPVFAPICELGELELRRGPETITLEAAAQATDISLALLLPELVTLGRLKPNIARVAKETPEKLIDTLRIWAAALRLNVPGHQALLQSLEVGDLSWTEMVDSTNDESIAALKSFLWNIKTAKKWAVGVEFFPQFKDLKFADLTVGGKGSPEIPLPYARSVDRAPTDEEAFVNPKAVKELVEEMTARYGEDDEVMYRARELMELARTFATARAEGEPLPIANLGEILTGAGGAGKTTAAMDLNRLKIFLGLKKGVFQQEHPELGFTPKVYSGAEVLDPKVNKKLPDGRTTLEAFAQDGYAVFVDEIGEAVKELKGVEDKKTQQDILAFGALIRRAVGHDGEHGITLGGYQHSFDLLVKEMKRQDPGFESRVRSDRPIHIRGVDLQDSFRAVLYNLKKVRDARTASRLPQFAVKKSDLLAFAAWVHAQGGTGNFRKIRLYLQDGINRASQNNLKLDMETLTGKPRPTWNKDLELAISDIEQNPDLTPESKRAIADHFGAWVGFFQDLWNGPNEELDIVKAFNNNDGVTAAEMYKQWLGEENDDSGLRDMAGGIRMPSRNAVVFKNSSVKFRPFTVQYHRAMVAAGMVDMAAGEKADPDRIAYVGGETQSKWLGETEEEIVRKTETAQAAVFNHSTAPSGGEDGNSSENNASYQGGLNQVAEGQLSGEINTSLILGIKEDAARRYFADPKHESVAMVFETAPRIHLTGLPDIEAVEKYAAERFQKLHLSFPGTWEESGLWQRLKSLGMTLHLTDTPQRLLEKALGDLYKEKGALGQLTIDNFIDRLYFVARAEALHAPEVRDEEGRRVLTVSLEHIKRVIEELEIEPIKKNNLLGALWDNFVRTAKRVGVAIDNFEARAADRRMILEEWQAIDDLIGVLANMSNKKLRSLSFEGDFEGIFTPLAKRALEAGHPQVDFEKLNGNQILGHARTVRNELSRQAYIDKVASTKLEDLYKSQLPHLAKDNSNKGWFGVFPDVGSNSPPSE
jgi:hypothetical protein